MSTTSATKGKGFAGSMKRHGFSGQGASHGAGGDTARRVHWWLLHPGARIPGHPDAGRMGSDRVTTQNLGLVHKVDAENGACC